MHSDLESILGGGHDVVHHEVHIHDVADEASLIAISGAAGILQTFNIGSNVAHVFHDVVQHHNEHSDNDHHNDQADLDLNGQRGWEDVSHLDHNTHFHLLRYSEAHDSNGDGISDAASKDIGIDPLSAHHQAVDVAWRDLHGHLHNNHGKDSDGDGWSDDLEKAIGTDWHDPASHPSLVEAHHFPAGSEENLPGTFDVTSASVPWL